jgi:ribose/xylose/arabinose/galactoside ABC-type transport system permease subunit
VYGTALGALLLAIISPALTQMGVNTYWTDLFTGVIIVSAVVISGIRDIGLGAFRKKASPARAEG